MCLNLWLISILSLNSDPRMINSIYFHSSSFLIGIWIHISSFILASVTHSDKIIWAIQCIHFHSLLFMWRLYHIPKVIIRRFVRNWNNLVFFIWIRIVNNLWLLIICRINRTLYSLICNIAIRSCLINSFWWCLISNNLWRSIIIGLNIYLFGWIIVARLERDSLSIYCPSISLDFLIFLQIYTTWCDRIFCLFLN